MSNVRPDPEVPRFRGSLRGSLGGSLAVENCAVYIGREFPLLVKSQDNAFDDPPMSD